MFIQAYNSVNFFVRLAIQIFAAEVSHCDTAEMSTTRELWLEFLDTVVVVVVKTTALTMHLTYARRDMSSVNNFKFVYEPN